MHMTNSPMSAEEPRLKQARGRGGGAMEVLREAQWGQLLLCKVFMGTSAEATSDRCVGGRGVCGREEVGV